MPRAKDELIYLGTKEFCIPSSQPPDCHTLIHAGRDSDSVTTWLIRSPTAVNLTPTRKPLGHVTHPGAEQTVGAQVG